MKVGFVGLGIMGSRMASHLIGEGIELILHNRNKEKAGQLLEKGAHWAEKLEDFSNVDLLITMLAHPEAVKAMATGKHGFLKHLRPDSIWVDCSTVNPTFARSMAAKAQAHQVRFIDAPVAGSKIPAEKAELVIFVGGNEEDLATCEPVLSKMSKKIVHVGGHGMGTSLKMVVNMQLAASMAAFAEGLTLGQGLGISMDTLFKVLLGGPVIAPFLSAKRHKLENGDYSPEFPLQWMQKDLQMASMAAFDSGVALPITNTTKEVYRLAMQAGLGENDFSAVYDFLSHGTDFNKDK